MRSFSPSQGHRVTALDASRAMIDRASQRKEDEARDAAVEFRLLPTEYLGALPPVHFDAVFSNFSGLNCVDDLSEVAAQLAHRTSAGAPVLVCFSARFCLWESAVVSAAWRAAQSCSSLVRTFDRSAQRHRCRRSLSNRWRYCKSLRTAVSPYVPQLALASSFRRLISNRGCSASLEYSQL